MVLGREQRGAKAARSRSQEKWEQVSLWCYEQVKDEKGPKNTYIFFGVAELEVGRACFSAPFFPAAAFSPVAPGPRVSPVAGTGCAVAADFGDFSIVPLLFSTGEATVGAGERGIYQTHRIKEREITNTWRAAGRARERDKERERGVLA